MINISDFSDKYFYVFSDCFITEGAKQLSVLDTTREKIFFMNSDYFELFEMMSEKKIGDIISSLNSDSDIEYFHMFIHKLLSLELGIFVDDISLFPPIITKWDSPSLITNSIIDIRNIIHDFEKISYELNKCRCKHVQVRAYSYLEISVLQKIISSFKEKSIVSVNLIIKYYDNNDYWTSIEHLAKNNTFLLLTLYGAPKEKTKNDMKNRISIISKNINSSDCCGEILKEDFIIPTIRSYMENYLYNGCLNRKISIDESGEIKNCPSMKRSYGNISKKSIFDVAKNENFQEFWKINKMQILICKDCEYRCICTDCRAFISEPENIYSKPSKCSYNPHTLKW